MLDKNLSESELSLCLVEAIISGSNEAERKMVERYQERLFNILMRLSDNRSVTEDISQETWLLVLLKVRNGELHNKRKLGPFIFQIGRNKLIMKYRSEKQQTQLPEHISDISMSPGRAFEQISLANSITSHLEKLGQKRDKELLYRFYVVGDSKSELCNDFLLSRNHFDRVIYRARERFRITWECAKVNHDYSLS